MYDNLSISISLTWSYLKSPFFLFCCKRHNSICRCWGLGCRHLLGCNTQSIVDNYVLPIATYHFADKIYSSQVWMSKLFHKEGWVPKNWKSTLNIHWKDWCWSWNSNTLAAWCKELTHWKRCWSWERLREGGDDTAWDDWMSSPTQWTWVWANSRI